MYAMAGAILASLAIGFLGGWKVEANARDAAELKRQQSEATARFKKEEKVDVAAVGHEQFKAKEEIRYVTRTKTVDRIVDRPVYRNICVDADGLQLLNDAIAGRDTASEPAPAVPRPGASP